MHVSYKTLNLAVDTVGIKRAHKYINKVQGGKGIKLNTLRRYLSGYDDMAPAYITVAATAILRSVGLKQTSHKVK